MFSGKGFKAIVLKRYVDKNYPGYQVHCAYEAGCCGYSAHRLFESYGWKSLVVNPADISKTGKSQYQKTDKIDARLICRELKDGRLESIRVPDKEREQLRSLFRRRNELVKDFRKVKSRLKAQLLFFGIKIPEEHDNPNWTHSFRNWIRAIKFEYNIGCVESRFKNLAKSRFR